jgi:hypothetical protein
MSERWWQRQPSRRVQRISIAAFVAVLLVGVGIFWHVITAPPQMQFAAHIIGPDGQYRASVSTIGGDVQNQALDISCHLGDAEIGTAVGGTYLEPGRWGNYFVGNLRGGTGSPSRTRTSRSNAR